MTRSNKIAPARPLKASLRRLALTAIPISALCASLLLAFPVLAQDTAASQKMADQMRFVEQYQQQRIEKLKLGVVRIDAEVGADRNNNDLGTGIVISSSPQRILILTALHVVKEAQKVSITFYSDQSIHFIAHRMSKFSSALDLAVLEVQSTPTATIPTNIPAYNYAANNTLAPTQHIYSVDGSWTLVSNNITRLNHDGDPQKFEYSNVSVSEGFSGGPVFDDYGDVIGMHDARNPEGTYAIAVKIDSALQTLEALDFTVPKAGPIVMPDYSAAYRAGPQSPAEAGATIAPAQAGAGANATFRARAPLQSRLHSDSSGSSSAPAITPPPSPCADHCETTLARLKHLHDFPASGRMGSVCRESVYAMPSTWPDGKSIMHVTWCLSGPGSLVQFLVRFAETDRQGDNDVQLGMAFMNGSSGQGHFITADNAFWKIILRNPNFGAPFNLNAVTISIEPLVKR